MSHVTDLPSQKRRVSEGVKPHYGADMTKLFASDIWWVPWAQLNHFLTVVGGTAETINIGGGQSISRIVPLRFKDDERLLAVRVDAEYKGLDPATGTWLGAEVSIDYESPQWPTDGPLAFIRINGSQSGRTMTIPASGALIGGQVPVIDPTLWVPGTRYSLTLINVPYLSDTLYQGLQRNVNSTTFFGIGPGYVMYNGAGFESNSVFGSNVFTWNITHEFEVSSILWNQESKRDGTLGDWTVGGSPAYAESDFSVLFYA